MTEHKTMNTIIHAAFRRDLIRFDDALAGFESGSRPRADQLKQAWDNFARQLHHHHDDEETIFWPAFRELGFTPELSAELEAEHERMSLALDGADAAMSAFQANPTGDETAAARAAMAELSSAMLDHLAHEERDLEPLAAANAGAPQVKQAAREVRKAHKGNAGTFFAWLQDGADPDAKAALRHEVPRPVLFMVTTFGGREYARRIAPTWS